MINRFRITTHLATGDFNHNNSLSKARAEAVVNELAGKYQTAKTRFISQGVGPYLPLHPIKPKRESKEQKSRNGVAISIDNYR